MNASLSIIIPTHDPDRPLARCLESAAAQMAPDDECIVVLDAFEMPDSARLAITDTVRSFGPRFSAFRYDAGHHCWGHHQQNYGLSCARRDFVLGNDDDDVFAPDAFEAIRTIIGNLEVPRPLLFRFRSYFGPVYWDRPRAVEHHIGGHCAVFPNIPERLGRYTCRYQGDYDFIRSTLDLWPGRDEDAVFVDSIIALARPS